jgi:outer membrane protein OmpA-like peptidoglycan-associated protein
VLRSGRLFLVATILATVTLPGLAVAQGPTPSAAEIQGRLAAPPKAPVPPQSRVTIPELTQRPDLRRNAPSIDIQSINFAFGSAAIPFSEVGKVENIAIALRRLLQRNPGEVFLIEGHTDAVGTRFANQVLSERRADSLRRLLDGEFGVPSRALITAGYGEDYLLVPVDYAEWRNRRVTLRRITDVIRPF